MSNDLTRQVLQKVRDYMAAQKMSMSEFGRQTGVSKAWLSKLKHTDANLSLNTAQDLLHYMGYTLRLTREGSFNIAPSRIKRYAKNYKSIVEAETAGTTTTTTTVVPAPAPIPSPTTPINNGQPVKLTPGQTITVSAGAGQEASCGEISCNDEEKSCDEKPSIENEFKAFLDKDFFTHLKRKK